MNEIDAIKAIKEHCCFANLVPDGKVALDMAIKALEQHNSDDCVSRQATLNAIIKKLCIKDESYLLQSEKVIYNVVKNMPPVASTDKNIKLVRAEEAAIVLGAQSVDSATQWYEKLLQLEMMGFNICKIKGEEDGSC